MPARSTPQRLRSAAGLPEQPSRNLSTGIGDLAAPRHLAPAARQEWRRIVKAASSHPSWLQHADRTVLELYTTWYAIYLEAEREIAAGGLLVKGRSSADHARSADVKNAAFSVLRAASAELRQLGASLGFAPAFRGRVDLGAEENERDDELRRLLS